MVSRRMPAFSAAARNALDRGSVVEKFGRACHVHDVAVATLNEMCYRRDDPARIVPRHERIPSDA